MEKRRKFWGWGWEDEGPSPEQVGRLAASVAKRLGIGELRSVAPPTVDELGLPPPRVRPPAALAQLCSTDAYDRAAHAYGKSFRDIVRAYRREYPHPPDVVAFPGDEADVARLLDWCADAGLAAIPYGGGSSVVGGVEADVGGGYAGAVSIDLSRLGRVLEVDRSSRAARIQAGVFGPALEDQLRPHGLTLRHFPQSFEFSTLGGWIATRSGGHYATLSTHIDDFVESLRVVTPAGVAESRRLPGSGAGPSPDRMFMGSEGTLGIITEAWMRLQDRPTFRATASVRFSDFASGVGAVRAVSQAGLYPSNCRLLDPAEALSAGAGSGEAVLVLGFESADHPVDAWMTRALERCADHGGEADVGSGEGGARQGAAGAWREAFLRAPYARDAMVGMGLVVDTFETSITWDRFGAFHAGVTEAATDALAKECGTGWLSCRFTHVYPDGPAPYYSFVGAGRLETAVGQWEAVKAAASDAVMALGGTITHHHAVGRDHRPWYDRQRPEPFARALSAAKRALDPAGVMNPGVLVDPPR